MIDMSYYSVGDKYYIAIDTTRKAWVGFLSMNAASETINWTQL